MTFLQQLALGLRTYLQAHRFIVNQGLYKFFLVPVIINMLLFSLLVWLGIGWAQVASTWLYKWFQLYTAHWENLNWLKNIVYWSLAILLQVIVFALFLSIIRYAMLVLIAPVLAYVSEKTEELSTGKSYPFSLSQLLQDAWRGMQIAVRNGVAEIIITILLLALGFVPVIGWFLSPMLLLLVQSYFYGFSMLDYFFERQKLSVSNSRNLISQYKWTAIGNGIFFNGSMYLLSVLTAALPFVLALLAKVLIVIPVFFLSILPIYSVVAGTLAALQIQETETNHGSKTR